MPDQEQIACEAFLRRLPGFLDGEVEPGERRGLAAHLEHCAHCLSIYRFERSILDTLRVKLRAAAVPEHLERRVHLLIERQLTREGGGCV